MNMAAKRVSSSYAIRPKLETVVYILTEKQEKGNSIARQQFSKQPQELKQARFLLDQAFVEDEQGDQDDAVELYMEVANLCLKTSKTTSDKELQTKLNTLTKQAVERVEKLKGISPTATATPEKEDKQQRAARPAPRIPPLGMNFFGNNSDKATESQSRNILPSSSSGEHYSREEIQVLRRTSLINGLEYMPFIMADLKERFIFPVPFGDSHGKLALAPKQKERFSRWLRPSDMFDDPTMIYAISSFSIKQTVVSDCSFVASLAISAAYERRFKKKLITSIIYPQNRHKEPQYNPCGKYMVKLHVNGIPRKIVIDDYLPVDHFGELLCSYSNNRNELWISLVEKAYMKVMGGYDFPGSNSNIDLHALTGWIPDRLSMHTDHTEFQAESTFSMLHQRFHRGHVLITIATGVMTEEEGEQRGLVPTHAYAVLDIQEAKGIKFLQLKNPWSHLRWKGRYSEQDIKNWTPDLQKALNYDIKTAQKVDNGVFWIDWDVACKFFDVIYLNWNPELFPVTTCLHSEWSAAEGPTRDAYSLSNNPQYRLEVTVPIGGTAVWVLLTRHITDKDDFAENKVFFTLVVYKTNGKKIYYPNDPPPHIDGIRINSPHYLTKLNLKEPGTHLYTLVVSQYEKHDTISYTLRVYGSRKFTLSKIPHPYPNYQRVKAEWKGKSAGGCTNYHATYSFNPIYQLRLTRAGPLLIEVRGPRQFSVGFEMVTVSSEGEAGLEPFEKKTSGNYRCGFCYLEVEKAPVGVYNVIPTTYLPNQEGPFFLDVYTSQPTKVSRLQ
uniref:calpain-7 isoform X1 n=1 Tax=Myxine glutinosa TaxID=7769 RepID=UPI00358EC8A2